MDCKQYQDALSAAALGFPTGANAETFAAHLEVCEACRHELTCRREFAKDLDGHVRTQLEVQPSADFNARLRRRIATESERTPRPFVSWAPILAGAASVVILLVLMQHHAGSGAVQPSTASSTSSEQASSPSAQSTALSEELSSLPVGSTTSSNPAAVPFLHSVALTHAPSPELEVRIDPREARAIEKFEHGAANGRINAAPLVQSASGQQSDNPMAELTPLSIAPLEVPLLEPRASDPQE